MKSGARFHACLVTAYPSPGSLTGVRDELDRSPLRVSAKSRHLKLGTGGLRGDVAAEAERVGLLAHGVDAKADVLFERNAQLFRAFADVIAADAFGESFVLEAALHGVDFKIKDAL